MSDEVSAGGPWRWDPATIVEVIDKIADAIILVDDSYHIVYWNWGAQEIFGYTSAEVSGRPLEVLLPDEAAAVHRTHIDRFLVSGQTALRVPLGARHTQVSARHKNGALFPVEITVTRASHNGQCTLSVILRDVTQRAQAEVMLHASEERYRGAETLWRLQRDLSVALSATSDLQVASRLLLDMVSQIDGIDCGGVYILDTRSGGLDLIYHRGLPAHFAASAAHFAADAPQARLVMAGNPIYMNYALLSLPKDEVRLREGLRGMGIIPLTHEGRAVAALNIASHTHDDIPMGARAAIETVAAYLGGVVVRLQAEAALRESQANLQALFNTLDDFLFILDDAGCILQTNPVVQKRLEYQADELVGRHVLDVHPPARRQEAAQIIAAMLAGATSHCPVPLLTRNGAAIPVETRVVRGRWSDRDVLFGISRDVTERYQAEQLVRLQRDLALALGAATDIETVGRMLVEKTCQIEGIDSGGVYLVDEQSGWLHPIHYGGPSTAWAEYFSDHKAEDPLNRAVSSGRPVYCDHIAQSVPDRPQHRQDGLRALAVLPLLHEGRVVACLAIGSHTHDEISLAMHTAIETIAAYAGGVIVRLKAETALTESQIRLQAALDALRHRQAFEEIITDASTHLINLQPEAVDSAITDALRAIGKFCQVDRSYVFLFTPDRLAMDNTHEWCAPGVTPERENLQGLPVSLLPWWMAHLVRLEHIHIPCVADLPPEASAEKEILEMQSIQSVVVVPLAIHDNLVGFLGFDSVREARTWSDEDIALLRVVGEMFANALEHKRAAEELAQSEARNQAILNAIPDLMFRISRDGIILDYHASSDHDLYRPRDEIIGTSLAQGLPAAIAELALAQVNQAIDSGDVQIFEYQLELERGTQTYEARLIACAPQEALAIVRNISERMQLEQMKSDFINRAAHELRTPLTTITLITDLIEEGGTEEELSEYWGILRSEISRQRLLVEKLLTVGRLESATMHMRNEPLNLVTLLYEGIDRIMVMAREKQIDVADQIAPQLPLVAGDREGIEQVLLNLLSNAVKFTPKSGTVTVIADREPGAVRVRIRDTGIGIPATDLVHLFDRFFRASNAIENEIQGTGVGLFIVKALLERMGGRISVESQLDQGATFTFWLPTADREVADEEF